MTARPRLVVASANPKKAAEIAEVLEGWDLVPRPADLPDVDETEPDFLGNARLKAVAVCEATGTAALADDSGLEVDHLDGAPGVRSARFAGEPADDEANLRLLLERLAGVDDRRARFRSIVVVRFPDGAEIVTEGSVEGSIAVAPRGSGGFGYDPVFVPDEGDGRTFGEMEPADKHAISHRGRALARLADELDRRAGGA
ncbi:MAG: RdgB/HAM1 family non-canonical purine NTP pyrophosphatase [Actinomycetota bacterium]